MLNTHTHSRWWHSDPVFWPPIFTYLCNSSLRNYLTQSLPFWRAGTRWRWSRATWATWARRCRRTSSRSATTRAPSTATVSSGRPHTSSARCAGIYIHYTVQYFFLFLFSNSFCSCGQGGSTLCPRFCFTLCTVYSIDIECRDSNPRRCDLSRVFYHFSRRRVGPIP